MLIMAPLVKELDKKPDYSAEATFRFAASFPLSIVYFFFLLNFYFLKHCT